MNKDKLAELLPKIVRLATMAGAKILEIQKSGQIDVQYKADKSPLTRADLAANDVIVAGLNKLTPDFLIISEEADIAGYQERKNARQLWLVDPLDGTAGFVAGRPDFTVNIALVVDGRPVLGVVYAPAFNVLYYGADGLGAFKQLGGQIAKQLTLPFSPVPEQLIVAASSSNLNRATKDYLAALGEYKIIKRGSSLKICYVADGTVALYPRFKPCMEWDTAAADAVLRAAGGTIVQAGSNKPLMYNKADLYNPSFIAKQDSTIL